MPSDKRNLITAKAMGLVFLLLDTTSSLDVPFSTLKYVQYILHKLIGPSFVSHLSSLTTKGEFCGRHVMASVNHP